MKMITLEDMLARWSALCKPCSQWYLPCTQLQIIQMNLTNSQIIWLCFFFESSSLLCSPCTQFQILHFNLTIEFKLAYSWNLQTFGEHQLISLSFNCYCPFGGILNFISISFSGSITFNIAITFIITKFLTNLMFLINFFQNSNIGIYYKIANFYNKIMFFID